MRGKEYERKDVNLWDYRICKTSSAFLKAASFSKQQFDSNGHKIVIFSYSSILTFILGAQKKLLIQMVILSTHSMRFCSDINKIK